MDEAEIGGEEGQGDGGDAGDPGCRGNQNPGTIIPRQVGDTAKASWQEYVGSDCGLITVTLGGRDYSRWVPCQ